MLSYIASNPMEDLIKGVCEELNITILSKIGEIDFLQYIKETKVNFKLIKYIIIELKSLKGIHLTSLKVNRSVWQKSREFH